MVGTVGYMLVEGWSLFDAFYMTTLTLTTVGYGEINPLTTGGRFFTILLMLGGIGAVAFGFSAISEYIITLSLTGLDYPKTHAEKNRQIKPSHHHMRVSAASGGTLPKN